MVAIQARDWEDAVAGGECDHLPVLHNLEPNDFRPGQHGDQVQKRPGVLFETGMLELSQGGKIDEVCGLYFHAGEFYQIKSGKWISPLSTFFFD
ncbi:MAG: hypothetical protein M0C28_29130 [Candidatus Moduliflexus flocculans]|nr:hypothetical protein [Candidatus Moduliflexus flocculans]